MCGRPNLMDFAMQAIAAGVVGTPEAFAKWVAEQRVREEADRKLHEDQLRVMFEGDRK